MYPELLRKFINVHNLTSLTTPLGVYTGWFR